MKTAMSRMLVAASGVLLAGGVLAGTPIDESRPVNADARVEIANISGNIKVTGWDRNEVHVTGELGEGVEELAIEGGPDDLSIEVRYPEGRHGRNWNVEDSRLEVSVPRGARLKADGVSADVSASGLTGEVRLNSVSGDVRAELDTGSPVRLNSVSGDVELRGRAGGATLESVSGDIRAEGVSGEVRLKTVSGDAELKADTLTRLDMDTVSGDLTASFGLAKGADVRAKSLSGEVNLLLPAGTSARIHADTYSGEIDSDFGSTSKEGRRLDATAGQGDADISVESFSGEVTIRRR